MLLLPVCLQQREEERKKVRDLMGEEVERLKDRIGGINHDQNILYAKNYFQLKKRTHSVIAANYVL